ncbi:Secreted protein [Vibrio aquimaris]|uniref:Uncharacterized protein n=1 Tax=Vibrio aquimaris TaxID=2587862 RepID=A0A5P9CLK1_9VIBR|nr:hypothetical protein FIV01_08380 [Vibrio aquimaris]
MILHTPHLTIALASEVICVLSLRLAMYSLIYCSVIRFPSTKLPNREFALNVSDQPANLIVAELVRLIVAQ